MRPAPTITATTLFVLLTAALLLAGCSLFNTTDPNAPLIADAHSPIVDVPVPAGFTMTTDSTSKVIPGNAIRFVDHHYKGGDPMLAVVRFYKEQLPTHDWKLIDQTQPSGSEVVLHFTKGSEDCTVSVDRGTLDTHIHIRIDPLGRNNATQ